MELNEMERTVLDALLRDDTETFRVLREQLRQAAVTSRDMSGVGFFTNFEVPASAPVLAGQPHFELGVAQGSAKNVEFGMGFLLFVTSGLLEFLEGFTYGDDPWPDNVEDFRLETVEPYVSPEG